MASMATRTMSALSEGWRCFPNAYGREGGREGGQRGHTERPDGAAELSSESSSGERWPRSAGSSAGRKAGSRGCSSPCAAEDEKRGPSAGGGRAGAVGRACWPYGAAGLAGGQEGWSCRWHAGAQPFVVPARGQQRPSRQGQRGRRASPADSGALCSHKAPADGADKRPSPGGRSSLPLRCCWCWAGKARRCSQLAFPSHAVGGRSVFAKQLAKWGQEL